MVAFPHRAASYRNAAPLRSRTHRARRIVAALLALPLTLSAAACGSSSDASPSSSDSSTSTSVSWLSQVDWTKYSVTDADLEFFGQLTAPLAAKDLFDHASEISVAVASGNGTKAMTDGNELLTSNATKPRESTASSDSTDSTDSTDSSSSSSSSTSSSASSASTVDFMTMDDSFKNATIDLHYELDNDTTPISDVFNNGLFDLAITPDSSSVTLSDILGLDSASASSSDSGQSTSELDQALDKYGMPTGIWYWNDTSYFDPTSAASGGAYELCWERDGYTFTIAVNDMIGTEYSMTNTSFTYYSGNAWKSFKTELQNGSIDGGNNNVRYSDFQTFYDSYLSPEAVASLEASASAAQSSAMASASSEAASSESASASESASSESSEASDSTDSESASASESSSDSTDGGSVSVE